MNNYDDTTDINDPVTAILVQALELNQGKFNRQMSSSTGQDTLRFIAESNRVGFETVMLQEMEAVNRNLGVIADAFNALVDSR